MVLTPNKKVITPLPSKSLLCCIQNPLDLLFLNYDLLTSFPRNTFYKSYLDFA